MKYTQYSGDLRQELNQIKKGNYNVLDAAKNPSIFAHHFLKLTPYTYQHLILRRFRIDDNAPPRANKRIMICKSRQIGISICLAMLAIWFACSGIKKSGPHNNTKVGIISRSDEQAKKLMAEIKQFVNNSPEISACLKEGRFVPSTKKELHFEEGWIKCYPPNDACRGETFDLLIIDEAAFVPGEIFRDAMEPTVTAVDGIIILSSTPKGQSGFFFELFDPNDVHKEHEYTRYWFNWRICENEGQKKLIQQKQKHAKRTGNLKSFEQEYNALFTVDEEAFFEDSDIEKAVDRGLSKLYESKLPCSIGIDYGMSKSATCITIVQNRKGIFEVIFQEAWFDFDENKLMDSSWDLSIPNLCKRYSVQHIVVDDCAQGNRTNKQLENEGYPVIRFDFRSDRHAGERNRGYYIFRSALKQGKVRYPELRNLMTEMKAINETRLSMTIKIKAPIGVNDDRCDSLMMACYPFLSDNKVFSSYLVDYEETIKEIREKSEKNKETNDGRTDHEWNNHLTKSGKVPESYLNLYGVR